MSAQSFDLGALGDVLSSLSEDDIAALQGMAASVFSDAAKTPPNSAPPEQNAASGAFGGLDLESIAKIASILEALQSEPQDPRTQLLAALRPLVGEERRQKVDQATRMLRLFSLLPKIKESGLF